MFKPLNPLLHSELRLAIMSLLLSVDSAAFSYLRKQTKATAGNLSVQLKKLEAAGYIKVKKSFKNNYPHTTCSITQKGLDAFQEYVNALKAYINQDE